MTAMEVSAEAPAKEARRKTVGRRLAFWACMFILAALAPFAAIAAGFGFGGPWGIALYYLAVFLLVGGSFLTLGQNAPEKLEAGAAAASVMAPQPKERERITIGLFDRLIIYAPLFAAEGLGYFEDEGLTVEFDTLIGDDRALASAVRDGKILFAACDPFVCLPEDEAKWNDDFADDDLLILMPLVKRFGITVFGHRSIVNRIRERGDINIISYETGSTTYQTAESFRQWLLTNLNQQLRTDFNLDERLKVVGVPMADKPFGRPETLATTLEKASFVLLWEPQTSWILEGLGSARVKSVFQDFGVVAIPSDAKPTGADELPFELVYSRRPIGSQGWLGPDQKCRAWTPAEQQQDGFRYLVTGLVTSRHVLRTRPDLCRRMFRAVSRACLRLHGANWTFDASDNMGVFKHVQMHLQTDHVVQRALEALVDPDKVAGAANTDASVFPFLQSLKTYQPNGYAFHLSRCHDLWADGQRRPEWYYRRFFAQPAELSTGA
jgi:hypothetical protein